MLIVLFSEDCCMTQDIENCPFCGDSHIHISHLRLTFFVVCQHCNGSGPRRRRIEDAVDQWNRLSRALAMARINEKGRTMPA
jgi:Lar family restriction alleviation protein